MIGAAYIAAIANQVKRRTVQECFNCLKVLQAETESDWNGRFHFGSDLPER